MRFVSSQINKERIRETAFALNEDGSLQLPVPIIQAGGGTFADAGIVEDRKGSSYHLKIFHRGHGERGNEKVRKDALEEYEKLKSLDGLKSSAAGSTPIAYAFGLTSNDDDIAGNRREGRYAILMERAAGRSLYDIVEGGYLSGDVRRLPSAGAVAKIGMNLALTYSQIHELGIVHRDVQPDNIFADPNNGFSLTIIDFGNSTNMGADHTFRRFATPYFGAPEVFRSGGPNVGFATIRQSVKQDIWSIGAILFYLRTGKCPHENEMKDLGGNINPEEYALIKESKELDLGATLAGIRLNNRRSNADYDENADGVLRAVILSCTQTNPEDRPTLADVYRELARIAETGIAQRTLESQASKIEPKVLLHPNPSTFQKTPRSPLLESLPELDDPTEKTGAASWHHNRYREATHQVSPSTSAHEDNPLRRPAELSKGQQPKNREYRRIDSESQDDLDKRAQKRLEFRIARGYFLWFALFALVLSTDYLGEKILTSFPHLHDALNIGIGLASLLFAVITIFAIVGILRRSESSSYKVTYCALGVVGLAFALTLGPSKWLLGVTQYDAAANIDNTAESDEAYQSAYFLLEEASNRGNPLSEASLGRLHLNGDGVEKDLGTAKVYFSDATHGGSKEKPFGPGNIGTILSPRTVELGHTEGLLGLSECEYYQDNFKDAFEGFTALANDGNSEAENWLGTCYEYGLGASQIEPETAFFYYSQSAGKNNPDAITNLARCYLCGFGTSQNIDRAAELFSKAATDYNHKFAVIMLGDRYYLGDSSLGQSYSKAVELYEQALDAFRGSPNAARRLAYCYQQGIGVSEPDEEKAQEIMEKYDLSEEDIEAPVSANSMTFSPPSF